MSTLIEALRARAFVEPNASLATLLYDAANELERLYIELEQLKYPLIKVENV